MTKVGFITTPLSGGHATRGVGFYTKNLLTHLKSQADNSEFDILEISNYLGQLDQLGKLDIVHYPFFDLFFPTLPLSRPAKTVVTVHDVIPLEFPKFYPPGLRGWLTLQRQKLSLTSVDRVITDSYASVQAIRKYLHVPHAKIKLVYLAAAPHFKPLKDRRPLADVAKKYRLPDKFVLYVGDINYNKNLPSLVQACRQLKTTLVIVGKRAAEIEQLDLRHRELSHLGGMQFEGTVRLGFVPDDDLVAIYNLAAVYCLPSFAEGFGLSVLEAMACGTPVACSATHSLPEVAGDAAVYFNPYNVDDMTTALKSLISSPALRRRLSRFGPAQASKFSWDRATWDTLAVYRELS